MPTAPEFWAYPIKDESGTEWPASLYVQKSRQLIGELQAELATLRAEVGALPGRIRAELAAGLAVRDETS